MDTAADAVITIDRGGIIESINPAVERMFGYSAQELVGQNVKMLMPSPYREEHDQYLANYLKTGVGRIIGIGREVTARRKDGSIIPVHLAVSEIDHLQMYTGILHDISNRKRLEREIVEIVALEQQRLGADLHDDCGQELTALGLLASSLIESLKEDSPRNVEMAVKISERIKRVLQYVRELAHGLKVEVGPSELSKALRQLTSRLRETSGKEFVFEGDGAPAVNDGLVATHLYHIAQEACTNALKHANAKTIDVSLDSQGGDLTLRVEDDGAGMPDKPQEGLGLRIMRNRASVIGAKLSIKRGTNGGTVVTCTLPLEVHGAQQ